MLVCYMSSSLFRPFVESFLAFLRKTINGLYTDELTQRYSTFLRLLKSVKACSYQGQIKRFWPKPAPIFSYSYILLLVYATGINRHQEKICCRFCSKHLIFCCSVNRIYTDAITQRHNFYYFYHLLNCILSLWSLHVLTNAIHQS